MNKLARYRIEYTKDRPVAFISHLDLTKAFERGARRAELNLAFSEGFNPHPKLSFGSVLPVGVTGEREYLDVELTQEISPAELKQRWQAQLPAGITLRLVRPVPANTPALMAVIDCARYQVQVPLPAQQPDDSLVQQAIAQVLSQTSLVITRQGKKGMRTVDIRSGILELTGRRDDNLLKLEMLLQTGSQGNVRPEEVLQALKDRGGLNIDFDGRRVIRTGLFIGADKQGSPLV